MKETKNVEEKVDIAFQKSIGKFYKDCSETELINREEYYRDIESQKAEIKDGWYKYFGREMMSGVRNGSIDIRSLNAAGVELISKLREGYEELKDELKDVEGEITIEEDFDCDLNIHNRSEYVDIVENLLYMYEVESEELRKKELREMYFKALFSEIENLDETQKKKAVEGGELLMNALLEEKNINKYDNNIDKIL